MAEPDFEQALERLVLADQAPGKLMALSEHSAVVVLPDRSYALIFRYLPGIDRGLGEHFKKLTAGLKAGSLHLVLIGGGPQQQPLLTGAQTGWSLRRRVGALQWMDGGGLWIGPRTRSGHPVAARLMELASGPSATLAPDVRARLAAAVDPDADGSRDLAAFAGRLRRVRPWVTWTGIGLCALMTGLASLWGGSEYVPAMIRLGANLPQLVGEGEWHRLAASIFLHAGPTHLLMNLMAFWFLGGFSERLLGPGRVAILFGLSGLAGAGASAWLGGGLSVGASGGLCGFLGAMAVLAFRPRVDLPIPVLLKLRRYAVLNLILIGLISMLPRIDLWAHLGGALMGAALVASRVLTSGPDLAGPPGAESGKRPRWLAVTAAAIAALTLAGPAWALVTGRAWELTGPTRPVRVVLGDSGLSLEVPELIAARLRSQADGPRLGFALGDLGLDPLMVSLGVGPGPEDLSSPELLAERLAELKHDRQAQPVEGANRRGPLHERNFGGVPTLEELFDYPSGVRHWRYSQLRPGQVITLEVLIWEGGPAQWSQQIEPIPESLRSDRSLRVKA